ncbi:hypothetical protein ACP70R_018788 [Stipagrostis hirtigluma subsp. patula]
MESAESHQREAMAMAPDRLPENFNGDDDFSYTEDEDDDGKIIVQCNWNPSIELEAMDLSETIHNFKYRLYDKTGIYPTFQSLTFRGKQLEDGCTLASYDIKKGSILHLVGRLIRSSRSYTTVVLIKKLAGETIWLPVSLSFDIAYIRAGTLAGKPLCDGRTLADYNIQDNSTLHLAPGRGSLSPPQ